MCFEFHSVVFAVAQCFGREVHGVTIHKTSELAANVRLAEKRTTEEA